MAAEIDWKKELILGAGLLTFGLVGLPLSVYVVGQYIIGEYAPDEGVMDLAQAIWADLAALSPWPWLLVLSPYIVISLLRLSWSAWRSPRAGSE